MQYVELLPAFSWSCKCGHVSFLNGTVAEMEPDDMDALAESVADVRIDAIPDWQEESEDGPEFMAEAVVPRVVLGPHKVSCEKCKRVFLTRTGTEEQPYSDGGA